MSIVSTRVKIYGDSDLQSLLKTVNGTTSLSQSVNVTGLFSATQYWAVAEATDDNGQVGYSEPYSFTTSGPSYVFSNDSVEYESDFDILFASVDVSGPSGINFTACGVQFCTLSDFSGTILSGTNTSGSANFFSGDVSGFAEHTTYYYRFFATTNEYGTQIYTPNNNTITTLYDEPTLAITASSVTDNTADLTFSYTGNYPIDTINYSDVHAYYMVDGGSPSSAVYLQFATLDNNVPETLHLSGLQANTTYFVEINVDFYDGEVTQSITFTTLATGYVTLSNINAYWDTQEAKLHFECDWSSVHAIAGASNNFRAYVSQNANFSPQQQVNTGWSRQSDGLSGTINSQPTALIPTTPGSAYYFKLVFHDSQGFDTTFTYTYYTPVSTTPGTFSYNAIASDSNDKNAIWFPTTITPSSFEYYPSKKRIIATKDNWTTISNTSGWKNWPNNGYELFIFFDPETYNTKMEVQDIYGNVFRSASDTQVICPQPTLFVGAENEYGQIYIYVKMNPNLDYTTGNNEMKIGITCDEDPEYSDSLDLSNNNQPTYYAHVLVNDGTYNVYLDMVSGNNTFSLSNTVTIKCTGYMEITDGSTFAEDKMTFQARYIMGIFNCDTNTFQVTIWDDNDQQLAQFSPIVTGDESAGVLTHSDGIQLPEGCDYVYYRVEVTNDGGYTKVGEVDINLS